MPISYVLFGKNSSDPQTNNGPKSDRVTSIPVERLLSSLSICCPKI